MGLDQYLSAEKYVGGWNHANDEEKERYRAIKQAIGVGDFHCEHSPSLTVRMNVAYWRKANQIHKWFVDNVQDGKDECQYANVSREQLQELVRLCKDVLTKSKTKKGKVHTGTRYSGGKKQRPVLREIIENSGKSSNLNQTVRNAGETFTDMVWRRLPKDLQKLWEELEGIHAGPDGDGLDGGREHPDAWERIERLFKATGPGAKRARQYLFFHALAGCNFNASEACRKVNVSASALRLWCKEPGFKELMEVELPKIMGDMAEGYVWRSAKQGEPAIIKHLMEGFIADRGYAKKRQIPDPNANGNVNVTVNIQSVLEQLPLDKRIDMLNAYRQAQAKAAIQPPKVVHELPPVEAKPDDVEEEVDDTESNG